MQATQRAEDENIHLTDIMDISMSQDTLVASSPAMIYRAALFLRIEVLSLKNSLAFPPNVSDLTKEGAETCIQPELFNFLAWLAAGDVTSDYDDGPITLERVQLLKETDHSPKNISAHQSKNFY